MLVLAIETVSMRSIQILVPYLALPLRGIIPLILNKIIQKGDRFIVGLIQQIPIGYIIHHHSCFTIHSIIERLQKRQILYPMVGTRTPIFLEPIPSIR